MVAIVPVLPGVTGYVNPYTGLRGGAVAATGVLTVDGRVFDRRNLSCFVFFFASVDDGDTFDVGPKKPVAAFWQGDDVDDDHVTATIIDVGGIDDASSIRFDAAAGGKSGYLLVFAQS